MDQHLTVREAKAFTNKSESTIKRLIREIVSTPGHEDRGMILPSSQEVERRKAAGDTFVWKLNRDFLLRRFPKDAGDKEGTGSSKKSAGEATDSTPIIQVLQEQLQSKDRQIQTLETQLDRKDDQIKGLNDRMHESNVLMGELQRRLVIAAPLSSKDSPIQAETVEDATRVPDRGVAAEPKKKSMFGRLFRKRQ